MSDVMLRLRREFDAAHQLPFHKGKCHHLHGHRWKVELGIKGPIRDDDPRDEQAGMVVDFGLVKKWLDRLLPDHLSFNEPVSAKNAGLAVPDEDSVWYYALENPTSERIAELLFNLLYDQIKAELKGRGFLHHVRVWETPDCDSTYYAGDGG